MFARFVNLRAAFQQFKLFSELRMQPDAVVAHASTDAHGFQIRAPDFQLHRGRAVLFHGRAVEAGHHLRQRHRLENQPAALPGQRAINLVRRQVLHD